MCFKSDIDKVYIHLTDISRNNYSHTGQASYHVRSSESSPFHPPCPFRDRLKKALRLSCDLKNKGLIFAMCRDTRHITDIPWVGRSVTTSADAVVAAMNQV